MLNIISTCWDILCVDINVDKRCVDHSTNKNLNFFEKKMGDLNFFEKKMGDEAEVEQCPFNGQVIYHSPTY